MMFIKIADTSIIKNPKTVGYFLQKWVMKCNDKNNNGKVQNFMKSTKANSATSHSGAMSLLHVGISFMYIETSSNNHGSNVVSTFERADFIHFSNITF